MGNFAKMLVNREKRRRKNMKKFSVKITAAMLSFVLMFTGAASLVVSADENSTIRIINNMNTVYEMRGNGTYMYFGFGYVPVELIYIDTPNTLDGVAAYHVLGDDDQDYVNMWNTYFDSTYPNATRLSTATIKYNCHSYAWYSRDVDNNEYWINEPDMFYQDFSYCSVSTPQVGDIICYFDDMGTSDVSDDFNVHSGIVTAVLSGTSNNLCGNSDLVTVTSKWGPYGLYSHNGYECPYTLYMRGDTTQIANYVRYFRSEHNNEYTFLNDAQHTFYCQECAHFGYDSHKYTEMESVSSTQHRLVCACGYTRGAVENHYAVSYVKKNNTSHYKYCACGYLIGTQTHDMYQSGLYNICRDCGCMVNKMTDITIKDIEDEVEPE